MNETDSQVRTIIDAVSTMNPTDALSVLVAATVSIIVAVWEKTDEQDKVAKKLGDLLVTQITAARWLQSQTDRPN